MAARSSPSLNADHHTVNTTTSNSSLFARMASGTSSPNFNPHANQSVATPPFSHHSQIQPSSSPHHHHLLHHLRPLRLLLQPWHRHHHALIIITIRPSTQLKLHPRAATFHARTQLHATMARLMSINPACASTYHHLHHDYYAQEEEGGGNKEKEVRKNRRGTKVHEYVMESRRRAHLLSC